MLELDSVAAGYDAKQVLFGVGLSIAAGEVVSLLGRNGMGKTTTVHCVMGFCPARGGAIRFNGADIGALPPHEIARRGIALVPEGRRVFPTLTVHENLIATSANRQRFPDPWTAPKIYELFPRLLERRGQMAGQLSGGEQQMLAIGRALMTNPLLLMLDEATEGLAPLVRREIWRCIERLKNGRQSILLIDKDLAALADIADRHYVLEKGKVMWRGDSRALRSDAAVWGRYLAV
jgi:branched-chain amino acid transport system ATP-binding protein